VALTTVVAVPAAAITVAAQLPEVGTSVVVNAPVASIAISVSVPSLQAGGVDLLAPTAAVVVAAVTPSLSVGAGGQDAGVAFWRDWAWAEDGVGLLSNE
jgi:uncharacterized membrane protein (DUF441 family)